MWLSFLHRDPLERLEWTSPVKRALVQPSKQKVLARYKSCDADLNEAEGADAARGRSPRVAEKG